MENCVTQEPLRGHVPNILTVRANVELQVRTLNSTFQRGVTLRSLVVFYVRRYTSATFERKVTLRTFARETVRAHVKHNLISLT